MANTLWIFLTDASYFSMYRVIYDSLIPFQLMHRMRGRINNNYVEQQSLSQSQTSTPYSYRYNSFPQ